MRTHRGYTRIGATWLIAAAVCMMAGCVSNPLQSRRLARYRPDVETRSPWAWQDREAEPPGAEVTETTGPDIRNTRKLRTGDELVVYLRGIPEPEDVPARIGDFGQVNLPLIGSVMIGGKSVGDAQQLIEKAYTDGGFYSEINVIVVPTAAEFFVRGEVKGPGLYRLSRAKTLMQAIAEAGGYTDFAKTSPIRIIRGEETQTFDARDIEEGRVKDPLIKPGDIIVVPARRFL